MGGQEKLHNWSHTQMTLKKGVLKGDDLSPNKRNSMSENKYVETEWELQVEVGGGAGKNYWEVRFNGIILF